jgi:uncharacterized protein involved in response to NO
LKLIKLLSKYLGSGSIYKYANGQAVSLTITKFSIITQRIIPIFETNSLYGVKQLDYLDFCKVAKMMIEKKHLTLEGVNLIRTIKSQMNQGRNFN